MNGDWQDVETTLTDKSVVLCKLVCDHVVEQASDLGMT